MFGFGVERHRRSTPKVFQDAKSGETWVQYNEADMSGAAFGVESAAVFMRRI